MNLQQLQESGWLARERFTEARELLEKDRREEERLPWIARFSMGLGAWFAGIFMIAFVLMLVDTLNFEEEVGFLVIGLVFLAAGVAVIRLKKNVFLDQLALVLSFAGYGVASFGMAEWWTGGDDFAGPLVLTLVLCPLVYWLCQHLVLKFMSVGWTWFAWYGHAFEVRSLWVLLLGLGVTMGILIAGFSGRWRHRIWRPLVISTLLALFGVVWMMSSEVSWRREPFYLEAYPAIGTMLALGFCFLLWWLERGSGLKSTLCVALFGLVAGTVGFAGAPGVAVALGLMAVAHARRDPWLGWMAVIALTGFMILFYYYLGVSLMAKSFSLMGTGAALLVFCGFLFKAERKSEELSANSES